MSKHIKNNDPSIVLVELAPYRLQTKENEYREKFDPLLSNVTAVVESLKKAFVAAKPE